MSSFWPWQTHYGFEGEYELVLAENESLKARVERLEFASNDISHSKRINEPRIDSQAVQTQNEQEIRSLKQKLKEMRLQNKRLKNELSQSKRTIAALKSKVVSSAVKKQKSPIQKHVHMHTRSAAMECMTFSYSAHHIANKSQCP